jgi:hypothetical protein
MRKIGILFIVIICLLAGCDESSKSVVSVKNDFKAVGNGKMIATIENAGDQLNLKGNLDLTAGEFSVYLSNPSGDTIYSESFNKSGTYTINEKFDRIVGNWIFSYNIVKIDDINPLGSFDFDLIYND